MKTCSALTSICTSRFCCGSPFWDEEHEIAEQTMTCLSVAADNPT